MRGSSILLFNGKWQSLSPGIKWAGHKPDHSPSSSGDVKKELRYAYTHHHHHPPPSPHMPSWHV